MRVAFFVVTRVLPAACRVLLAAVVRLFSFLDAHHAVILSTGSYALASDLAVSSPLLPPARAALIYFVTSAACALISEVKMQGPISVTDIFEEEVAFLKVAFAKLFPPTPAK